MHGKRFQVDATLRMISPHARMWVQSDLDMDHQDLVGLSRLLEEEIYPSIFGLFGGEPPTGAGPVDLVFTDRLGIRLAGYFSPHDMLHSQISETSNGRSMIVINVKLVKGVDQLGGLLAHELQHLIHWGFDSNESAWVQEGFSHFGMMLLGYDPGPGASAYLSRTDLQLNAWPMDGDRSAHYGAASLLITYLYDRFGPDFVKALALHPQGGLEALDAVLLEASFWDSGSGQVLLSEDVLMDWGLANYLQLDAGNYAYGEGRDTARATETEFVSPCEAGSTDHTVSQYGFDYIRVKCKEAAQLTFVGDISSRLLPTRAHSGEYFFWSNRGNQADMTLTREFDFADVVGPLTLRFWTWYELEKNFDFVYLLASEDGESWSFLETTSGSPAPGTRGMQFGWGFTGINRLSEWSRQTVDLSQFAGMKVTLRFEYVTDTARTGAGFLIDDISIVETQYYSDFEDGNGGWNGDGFIRVNNAIPQSFRAAVVRLGGALSVEHLTLDASNHASVALDAGEEVVLVVMGATRHTRQPAGYMLSFSP
ncbi:MAG: immune inhibitor A [Chloroflexi bacterium]|nr:immune inhibitor A [Chloroflexota bacterium]